MKRKVNLVGQNTLTISLPSKWTKKNKIEKGNELETSLEKNKITFSKSKTSEKPKEITINIDGFTYYTLTRYLTLLYRLNYSKIILTYSSNQLYDYMKKKDFPTKELISERINRFIGAEITSQTTKKTEIECLVSKEDPDLDKIERRISYLTKETIEEFMGLIKRKEKNIQEVVTTHIDNTYKFINYFLRELDRSNLPEDKKRIAYSFYITLENLLSDIFISSKNIDVQDCKKETITHMEIIFEIFLEHFELLKTKKSNLEIINMRYEIIKKREPIKYDEESKSKDQRTLFGLNRFLNVMNDFTEYAITKNLP